MIAEHLLVTTEWLAAHLDDEQLRIVDIRGHVLPATEAPPHYFNHHDDYLKQHIPGAVFVDWVKGITDPDDPRHAQIAKPQRFQVAMRHIGINTDTMVVAYDDANGLFAARMWWALNYFGHSKVAVLDGGWQKWLSENRPVTDVLPSVAEGNFTATINPDWIRTDEQVEAALHSDTQLIDVRSPLEFEGKASRAARKGHIPGALHMPRRRLLQDDGTLFDADTLRVKFQEAGLIDLNNELVTYCNGGVSASYVMLALQVAGYHNTAMYDASWKSWGNDPSKPIS